MAASEGGLRVYSAGGSGYDPSNTMAFNIVASEATDLFHGDVVKLVSDGTVVAMSAVSDTPVLGVFVGCEYTNNDGGMTFSNKYTDAITAEGTTAHVLVNPYQLYTIQISDGSDGNTTLTRLAIGLNYDIEFNTGNSTSGMSGMCLDTSTAGATTAANLRLVGLTNLDGTSDMAGTASTTYSYGIVMIDPKISFWIDGPGL